MSRLTRFLPLVALVAIVAIAVSTLTGKDDKYVVNAQFDDAGGILKNYNVKISGVPAGKVKKISLDKNDHVIVQMKIDKDAAPIGPGATATVRPVNLLGEKYIDLNPGDLSKPLPSGTLIAQSRTKVPVEIDDALNILDPDTRTAMKILINEAGISMAGRGADFNRMLTNLPPALDSARKVVGEIADENAQLENAVVKGDRVINEMNAKRDNLVDFINSGGRALEAAAQRREKLGQTIQAAPAALAQLRATLGQLQTASTQLQPAVKDLRATTPSLATTLRRVPQFADDAKATLDTATRVAPTLNKLAVRSTPTLKRLRPTVDNLAKFSTDSGELMTWLADKNAFGKLMEFAATWASVTDSKDGISHMFRIHVSLDEQALASVLSKYGITKRQNAAKKIGKAPDAAPATAPAAAPPATKPELKLPKLPIALPPVLKQTLDNVGKTVDGVVGALTGQSKSGTDEGDTKKLLNYLLGP